MTNKEAAKKLGCSITTACRWTCGWCDQPMISVAKGYCGSMVDDKCDTEARVKAFAERDRKKAA